MSEHERYIIDEREVELLDKYEGAMSQTKDPYSPYNDREKETVAFEVIKGKMESDTE